MRNSVIDPDVYTFPLVLRGCASCGRILRGMSVHGLCLKLGFEKNLFIASALVFLYVTTGRIYDARKVFDGMSQRDAVLWTAMLAGYAQHGETSLSLEVYRKMVGEGVELDGVVMVTLLLVCGQLRLLSHGKSVHGWTVRRCLGLKLSMGNALVDMYVKCSALGSGHTVFNRMQERDVISWSTLILGYGLNGSVSVALELFEWMCADRVKPNDVTFLGVLSACAHAGMVDKARAFFDMMKDYGVVAELKHYACMVDCLGKAGLIEEAEMFIDEMPVEPDGAVLGALLGGCRVHGNIEVAERVAKKLLMLEPERGGYYVLLANIYADSGRYSDAEKVRDFMKQRNVSKLPGCSQI
ncbi:Pentatricopeptide repeat-containing protein [Thalictrum thalictroides]|uniref:Pentatricopeptide repeat-containing protein n=1 Tax=Thalictrum thalictroides TaxID=46969 RepID=A0A7J6V748_THATH|nr:Pentatricopeptide repeat-containing protein [Thalictrum thalictroides]